MSVSTHIYSYPDVGVALKLDIYFASLSQVCSYFHSSNTVYSLGFFFFFSSPSGCPLFCFFFFLLLICEGSYTVPNEFTLTLLFNYRLPETQFRPLFSSMEDHWSLETGSFYAETSRVSIRTFPNQLFLKH